MPSRRRSGHRGHQRALRRLDLPHRLEGSGANPGPGLCPLSLPEPPGALLGSVSFLRVPARCQRLLRLLAETRAAFLFLRAKSQGKVCRHAERASDLNWAWLTCSILSFFLGVLQVQGCHRLLQVCEGLDAAGAGGRLRVTQCCPPALFYWLHSSLHPSGLLCAGDSGLQRGPDTYVQPRRSQHHWTLVLRTAGCLLLGEQAVAGQASGSLFLSLAQLRGFVGSGVSYSSHRSPI